VDFSLVALPDEFVVVEAAVAEEADPLTEARDCAFVWVQVELQTLQESLDFSFVFLKCGFVRVNDDEVIHVPDVVFHSKCVFDELVELVEVYVCKKLACPVTERHSFANRVVRIVVKYDLGKPEHAIVLDAFSDDGQENIVIDGFEIVPDVGLQDVCLVRVVL